MCGYIETTNRNVNDRIWNNVGKGSLVIETKITNSYLMNKESTPQDNQPESENETK